MIDDNPELWERPAYVPGGGPAMLCYKLFGAFNKSLVDELSNKLMDTSGQASIEFYERSVDADPIDAAFEYYASKRLAESDPYLHSEAKAAPGMIKILYSINDPATLDYIHENLALIDFALAHGAVAVFDLMSLSWFSKSDWLDLFAGTEGINHCDQVKFVASEFEDDDNQFWLHTRGMLKFGRPDLSIESVPEPAIDEAIDLLSWLTEEQARGLFLQDEQVIETPGFSAFSAVTCRIAANRDDPDFNNEHIRLVPVVA